MELAEFVFGVGIVEAEHRRQVARRFEAFQRPAAHALRRRAGIGELGMGGFELTKLAHEPVELRIGDHRRVVNVIPFFVVADLLAQSLDAF